MSEAASTFRLALRVYYEDTDAGGVVYYANYLRFLERARTEWLRQLGCAREELRAECGWLFVVRRVEADYLRPARLDDLLTVHARVVETRGASLVFKQWITHEAGHELMHARVQVACVDAQHFRPQRLPRPLLEQLP
ncbi:tol-pal system-associated acyl-CoA thioesterase [Inhella sp.]|uniref:tol-pal system-associated acyl-CoA thioesterase n=1 Tax=Inhella sp. TaxID=1921806 RepID=UPI0035AFC578